MARELTNTRQFGQAAPGTRGSGSTRGLLPAGAKVGIQTGNGGGSVTKPPADLSKGGRGDLVVNSRPAR